MSSSRNGFGSSDSGRELGDLLPKSDKMAATRGAYGATGDEHKLAGAVGLSLSATPRSDSGWRKVVGRAITLLALTCTVGATVSLAQRSFATLELSTSEGMSADAHVEESISGTRARWHWL